ncbi:MAG: hypothetical protein EA402_04315 [Planctomycetota bacterium]|nr:MAG: hypothetical protein EA402_04315 [Planctomycetota bacterium]
MLPSCRGGVLSSLKDLPHEGYGPGLIPETANAIPAFVLGGAMLPSPQQRFPFIQPCFVLALLLLLQGPSLSAVEAPPPPASPAREVQLLLGDAYFQALLQAFAAAEEEIAVIMFAMVLPDQARPHHRVRRLAEALAAAQNRGVRVRVLLDEGRDRDGEPETLNDAAADFLHQLGVQVHRDGDDQRTHTKTVVVDGQYSFVGSANWTHSAMVHNREHSLRVDSPALALALLADFDQAWAESRPHRAGR